MHTRRSTGAARRAVLVPVLVPVLLVALLTLLTGCSQLPGQGDAEDDSPDAAGATDVLSVVGWNVLDGMVSVLVRNDGDRTLRRASALVTAVDEHGVTIASSSVQAARSDCCTVLDLPPAMTYGLYFDTTVDAATIADVVVRYRDVSWRPADAPRGPAVEATPVEVRAAADGTVVLADVTPSADPVDGATVQALLAGADGRFLAVVSGRWHCFAAGATRRIEMELQHPVPAGTTVTGVEVLPILLPNVTTGYVDAVDPEADGCVDRS